MIAILLWFIPTFICYVVLVVYCDWFLGFRRRRDEYLVFVPLAIVWPATAMVAFWRAVLVVWRGMRAT